jgi:MOSC domain-containing protein YiiM
MNLLSVNAGLPQSKLWHGQEVHTSIFKRPADGRVALRKLNLDGDRQADLSVHGGPGKAVYCYPSEHYTYWKHELPEWQLAPGTFGENFTTVGLLEESARVGDRFRIGTAEVAITQPRLPCFKLGLRFQSDDMVRRFLASNRLGFYFAVVKEGDVGAGDVIEFISRDPAAVGVSEIARLYVAKHYRPADVETASRALQLQALPHSWKEYLAERLETYKREGVRNDL